MTVLTCTVIVMRRNRHAFTLFEVTIVLVLIGLLSVFAISQFGGGDIQAADRVAKSTNEAALDAAYSIISLTGDVEAITPQRLALEEVSIEFIAAGTAATSSDQASVSVNTAEQAVGVSTHTEDGSCFLSRLALGGITDEPRLFAIGIPESGVACTGDAALAIANIVSQPERGSSWSSPLILETAPVTTPTTVAPATTAPPTTIETTTTTNPATPPGPVTNVTAAPLPGAATISWTAPASNGGAVLTGFRLIATASGQPTRTLNVSAATTTTTLTQLNDGFTYTIAVHARNSVGSSTAATTTVAPSAPPAQVTGVVSVPGNASASVSWDASVATPANPLTGYRVFVDGVLNATVLAPTVTYNMTGLANGGGYLIQVAAYGPAGEGPLSVGAPTTPYTTAPAPTAVLGSAGAGQVSVSFTPPTSDGGSVITSYTVTATPGGLTTTATSSPLIVAGLTNGQSYTFSVVTTNAAGNSESSAASPAVTPLA